MLVENVRFSYDIRRFTYGGTTTYFLLKVQQVTARQVDNLRFTDSHKFSENPSVYDDLCDQLFHHPSHFIILNKRINKLIKSEPYLCKINPFTLCSASEGTEGGGAVKCTRRRATKCHPVDDSGTVRTNP